ncbi:MAG: hypothetical protein J0L91_07410 [Burkholderiales bacterium]|nr:hypothetical protein [Burkholderiales bacterium]
MKPSTRLLSCPSLLSLLSLGSRPFAALAAVIALALGGCGGGGENFASGGIVGTGDARLLSSGILTATAPGAIVVNGQTVSVAGAAISVNGAAATLADLRVGMVVAVDGKVNADGTAIATSVSYRSEITGVVDGVDATARTFTVVGQSVRTDPLTVYEGGLFDAMLGQKVEVSGLRTGPASLYATWVRITADVPAPRVDVEVVGAVTSLDPVARRFSVGSQVVVYTTLAAASIPAGLANGVTVRVAGTMPAAGGDLAATSIAIVTSPLPGQNAQRVEIEGFVSDYTSLASFRVAGQQVDARGATFEDGSAAALADGVRVEVEGRLEAGVVIASKVEFETQANVDLDGNVQSVDPAGRSFTVAGEKIAVVASTQFEDKRQPPEPGFGLAKLAIGDRVSVKAYRGASGLVAQRVERRAVDAPPPGDPTVKIEGTISAYLSVSDFTVAGQRVNATGAKFEGGKASDLRVGLGVEVEGVPSAGVLLATRVEIASSDPPEGTSVKVSGPISAFVSRSNFVVAGQQVDASGAEFENGAASDLADGRTVEASGPIVGGALRATKVKFASSAGDTTVEIEGTIQNFVSRSNFRVDGQPVDAGNAEFSDGTAGDLANGRRVKVRGPLVSGIVKATRVSFEDEDEGGEVEVKGTISSFVSRSNFKVAGRAIDAGGATFEDGSASDLANGRSVEVKGTLDGSVVRASKVKFRDD